jgi:hypothetical protein
VQAAQLLVAHNMLAPAVAVLVVLDKTELDPELVLVA